MNEMSIDVDETRAAGRLDDMVVPDFVIQRTRLGHDKLQRPSAQTKGDGALSMPNDAMMEGPTRGLRAGRIGGWRVLLMLRQTVRDREPSRLGADEDVPVRADGGIVNESSHGDMNIGAGADERIEERTACFAMRVVAGFVAKDQKVVSPLGKRQLVALYAGERLKGRAGGAPAIRTVAVRRIDEFVGNRVVDGAATAFAD
jgi:hypothetical protein